MKNKSLKRRNSSKNDKKETGRSFFFSSSVKERSIVKTFDSAETNRHCQMFDVKKEKLLKRELLRAEEQRKIDFFNLIRRSSSAKRKNRFSSSVDRLSRRVSLCIDEATMHVDQFGPWTEKSNEISLPKSKELCRTTKINSQTSISRESTQNFYQSSIETTIELYRKQKGYQLEFPFRKSTSDVIFPEIEEKSFVTSTNERFKSQIFQSDILSSTSSKSTRHFLDSMEPSLKIASIPTSDLSNFQTFPLINMRNGNLRPTRPIYNQTVLPSLICSTISSSSNGTDKSFNQATKTNFNQTSKLFFVQGRQKKR